MKRITMTTIRHTVCAASMLAMLAACGKAGDGAVVQMPAGLPTVETVNGQPVPQLLLELVARERQLDLGVPEQREKALNELTEFVLLAQVAQQQGYARDPEFSATVEVVRLQAIANATYDRFRNDAVVDDSVLKAEYDRQVERAGKFEYDLTQLIFDDEETALKVAGEAVGKPFDGVFEAWKDKAKQARSFSRARIDQMPEPLAKALVEMKSGDTSTVPVKTDYGWHIVHIGAALPFTPPPFEQVKDKVRDTLRMQLADQRLAKLREEAKITLEAPAPAPADGKN